MGIRSNKFIIIVPVYNAEKYIKKCLESILTQKYKNYELVVIDDCSTDDTYKIINEMYAKYNDRFTIHRTDYRIGSPIENFIKGIELCSINKEDVLVTVDGDDWLYDNNVLTYLNKVYQDEEIYMTYGQYEPLSKSYSNYCKPIPDTRTYRKSGLWLASHLRTVKRKLFDRINKEDLKQKDGEYYKFAGDTAYIYPIIEMAGKKHMKFIDKVLYVYNDLNPGNEMKVNVNKQLEMAKEIRERSIYNEIDKL